MTLRAAYWYSLELFDLQKRLLSGIKSLWTMSHEKFLNSKPYSSKLHDISLSHFYTVIMYFNRVFTALVLRDCAQLISSLIRKPYDLPDLFEMSEGIVKFTLIVV